MANNQSGGPGEAGKSGSAGASGKPGPEPKRKPGINDIFLSALKSRSGRETTAWINNLTKEGMQEIENAALTITASSASTALPAQFAHPSIAQTQVKWVDSLFDHFQQFEEDFNRVNQIADLRVNTERPEITSELFARLQSNDQCQFSGKLYTRYWMLAVKGNLSYVEGYMVPADHFIAFENNIVSYAPFFVFKPMWDGDLKWSFERGSISFGQLRTMAKLIFGQLVKIAKGDSDGEETFNYGMSAPPRQAGEFGKSRPPVPADDEDSTSSDLLDQHSAVFEDDKPMQSDSTNEFASYGKKETAAPKTGAAEIAGTNAKRSTGSPSGATAAPAVRTSNVKADDISLDVACEILVKAVSKELDSLSKEGGRAFEEHDFVAVEKLMKRTSKLKEVRDQILTNITEWKKMIAEER